MPSAFVLCQGTGGRCGNQLLTSPSIVNQLNWRILDDLLRSLTEPCHSTILQKIKKFSLNFTYKEQIEEQMESWLRFATSHELEELSLDLGDESQVLPPFLYANCPAAKLSLASLSLDFDGSEQSISWTSLKILSLTDISLESETIEAILLGSPLIESLTLRECELFGATDTVAATSLKELVIDDCSSTNELSISAPNLLSLTVVVNFRKILIKLLDVSSLKEATINLQKETNSERLDHREADMLKGLLEKLAHVNKLTVGYLCQALSIMMHKHERLPTLTWKILEKDMELMKPCILGLVAFLQTYPDVEHLTVNVIPSETYGVSLDDDSCFVANCDSCRPMKYIKITGFVAGSCAGSDEVLIDIVQRFLAKAKGLKKLIIYAEEDNLLSKPAKARKLLEIAERLLCLPRASPEAVAVFKSDLR